MSAIEQPTQAPPETKKNFSHFNHPTEPNRYWCGAPRDGTRTPQTGNAVECVVCMDQLHRYGRALWWELRRRSGL